MDDAAIAADLRGYLTDMIAIPSMYPPGNTRSICEYAAERFRSAGYRVAAHEHRAPIQNILAEIGEGRPVLAFNAHIDTVDAGDAAAWESDPYTAAERNGNIHGLGANNCKASAALYLWLAGEIARRGGPGLGKLVFALTGDEERLGPEGTLFLKEHGLLAPDVLVLGGPTENQLITEERGVLWVRVRTKGRAAHGGDPDAGDNAIFRMIRMLEHLRLTLSPALASRRTGEKRSTMNIGLIHGGDNVNVVPAVCEAMIDRRLLPGESVEHGFDEIRAILSEAGEPDESYSIERVTGTNGFSAATDGPAISALAEAVAERTGAAPRFLNALAVSDGRYFANEGIEIVTFGPGDGATSHAPNEFVPLDQMVDAAHILRGFVQRYMGGQSV